MQHWSNGPLCSTWVAKLLWNHGMHECPLQQQKFILSYFKNRPVQAFWHQFYLEGGLKLLHKRVTVRFPDCKVCYARRRSSPRTFGCVRGKYTGYILSAQYFAKNSICRVEKHSKCKILKTIRYWNTCPPCGHIFWSLSHSFHSRINGQLNCLPRALSKLCNLVRFADEYINWKSRIFDSQHANFGAHILIR